MLKIPWPTRILFIKLLLFSNLIKVEWARPMNSHFSRVHIDFIFPDWWTLELVWGSLEAPNSLTNSTDWKLGFDFKGKINSSATWNLSLALRLPKRSKPCRATTHWLSRFLLCGPVGIPRKFLIRSAKCKKWIQARSPVHTMLNPSTVSLSDMKCLFSKWFVFNDIAEFCEFCKNSQADTIYRWPLTVLNVFQS